jgi:c(7)-type cytochrome triheme protein
MTAARVFLDLPQSPASRGRRSGSGGAGLPEDIDSLLAIVRRESQPKALPALPIFAVADADSALRVLPKDRAGSVDWNAALREGVIRAEGPPSNGTPRPQPATFGYDLYMGDGDGPTAYFPHSVHGTLLYCESCHPKVYPENPLRRDGSNAHSEKSCGYCHGSIAFSIDTCERCHQEADDLPANRREPKFEEPVEMRRATAAERDSLGGAVLPEADVQTYPPALFPHWRHRVRFACSACHETPFPLGNGRRVMTQDEAHGLPGCGKCHDGVTAFETGLTDCYRCHTTPPGG